MAAVFIIFIFKLFIFNWRIIALQYCVGFYILSTRISHRYIYIYIYICNLPLECLSHLPPHSHTSRLSQSARFELPASYSRFPLAAVFKWCLLFLSIVFMVYKYIFIHKWQLPYFLISKAHIFSLFHYSLLQDVEYSPLCYIRGSCWLSVLYIVVCIC